MSKIPKNYVRRNKEFSSGLPKEAGYIATQEEKEPPTAAATPSPELPDWLGRKELSRSSSPSFIPPNTTAVCALPVFNSLLLHTIPSRTLPANHSPASRITVHEAIQSGEYRDTFHSWNTSDPTSIISDFTPEYIPDSPSSFENKSSPPEYKHITEREVIRPSSPNILQESSQRSPDSPIQTHTCQWADCNAEFYHFTGLVDHVNKKHVYARSERDAPYTCQWKDCLRKGKGFNARYKMLIHIRVHTQEKPHSCSVCGKSFSRVENLKIHIRTHTGERPYSCPYDGCSKAYSNSSDRIKHIRTHQTNKPFPCKSPGCGKSYTDPSSLRKHCRIHNHWTRNENLPKSSADLQSHLTIRQPPASLFPPQTNIAHITTATSQLQSVGGQNLHHQTPMGLVDIPVRPTLCSSLPRKPILFSPRIICSNM